ncbi:MAG: hypothetical protein L0Z49_09210 [Actinobacteria bacterium]|nr:hypothetical protein [Actinomycetota bacterium]
MNRALTILLALVAVSCSPGATTTSTTTTTPPTPETTTTTIPGTTTTLTGPGTTQAAQPVDQMVTVLLAPFSEMGPGWTETYFPYGDDPEHLGTSIGGDGGLLLGPEYGSQAPDGSWWFFDGANLRLAHFAEDGSYLDSVPVPEDLLTDGIYFQYQMPQVLDDGSLSGFGFLGEASSAILRLVDGVASSFMVESDVAWALTDGESLYGLSFSDRLPYRLDVAEQSLEQVEWLGARDGSRFMLTVDNESNEVRVDLPDAGVNRTLQMRFSEDPEVPAFVAIEVETGVDGSIHILFYGAPQSDDTLGIGGFLSIGADGAVGEVEPIVDPFSPSDPGSPAHLGVRPGTSTPWIMVIGEDGVHVYTATG